MTGFVRPARRRKRVDGVMAPKLRSQLVAVAGTWMINTQ